MSVPITNAKDTLLTQNPGTLPNVSDAMRDWFQAMNFITVVKTINALGQLVETDTTINFLGVWQPFSAQQLALKPEGERDWSWFLLHADPSLSLKPDDIVTYQSVDYRVSSKRDFTNYGYIEYEMHEDYES